MRCRKREEIVSVFKSEQPCLVMHGPPGSLKTACIQWAARTANFSVDEIVIEGAWREERMRSQIEKAVGKTCFLVSETDASTCDGNRVVVVYNADMDNLPEKSFTELLNRTCTQKTNKFILEMSEVSPLFFRRYTP